MVAKKKKKQEELSQKQIFSTAITFVMGVVLYAFCYNLLLLPNNLVVSGMSGIGVVLENTIGFSSTIFIYISSFIMLIVSFIFLGFEKTKKTILGSILYPLMVTLTKPIAEFLLFYFPLKDSFLILVFAIILYGISSGMIYKYGYTTGGSDVIMQILNKYLKIGDSKAMRYSNYIIIIFGGIAFGYVKAIYSFLILTVSSVFVDKVMFGVADSKLFYIYTKKEKEVKDLILKEMESGFTILPTKGGYSHENGSLIMCVVGNNDYYSFKDRLLFIDPDAFFVIESCYEVNGGVVKKHELPFF